MIRAVLKDVWDMVFPLLLAALLLILVYALLSWALNGSYRKVTFFGVKIELIPPDRPESPEKPDVPRKP